MSFENRSMAHTLAEYLNPDRGKSRKIRRWDPFLRRLLERVCERNQSRLAAGHSGEADAVRLRLCVERIGERWGRSVWNHREGNDDGRIPGTRGDRGAAGPWEEQRVEPLGLHH